MADLHSPYQNSQAFQLYTSNTDGKAKIAGYVASLAHHRFGQQGVLLDLGAGDGLLTKELAPTFSKIIAVERDPVFKDALGSIANVQPVIARMEELELPRSSYDVALLSYSFTGVLEGERERFLTRLWRAKSPNGFVLAVTFQDGCRWDRFADEIYSALGKTRSGGTRYHMRELQRCGWRAEVIRSIPTQIWAPNIEGLIDVLEYFFAKTDGEREIYRELAQSILPSYVDAGPEGSTGVDVVEDVLLIQPEHES